MDNTFSPQETTRKRRRWGCTCGCLIFFLGLTLGGLALIFYAFRPYPIAPKEQWMTAANDGFGILRLNSDDPGVQEFVSYYVRQIEARQKAKLSEADGKAMSAGMSVIRQFIEGFLHRDVFVYFTYDPANEGENVLAVVQFRHLASWLLLKMLMGTSDLQPIQRMDGAELFARPKDTVSSQPLFGFSRRYLALSSDSEALRTAMKPPKNIEKEGGSAQQLTEYLADLNVETPEAGEDFSAVFMNTEGRLRAGLQRLEREAGSSGLAERMLNVLTDHKLSLNNIGALRISGDIASADKVKFSFSLYCRQPEMAKKFVDVLRAVTVPQILRQSENSPITRKADAKQQGSQAILAIEISGIKAWTKQNLFDDRTPNKPATAPAREAK
jgi:hypothetical protein